MIHPLTGGTVTDAGKASIITGLTRLSVWSGTAERRMRRLQDEMREDAARLRAGDLSPLEYAELADRIATRAQEVADESQALVFRVRAVVAIVWSR